MERICCDCGAAIGPGDSEGSCRACSGARHRTAAVSAQGALEQAVFSSSGLTGAAIVALIGLGDELRRQTDLLAEIRCSLGLIAGEIHALRAAMVTVTRDREVLESEGAVERAALLLERGLVEEGLALARKAVALDPASPAAWLSVVYAVGARVLASPSVAPDQAEQLWREGTEALTKTLRLSPVFGSAATDVRPFYAACLGAAEFLRSEEIAGVIVEQLAASFRAQGTSGLRRAHPAVALLAQVARRFPRLGAGLARELDVSIAAKLTTPFFHMERLEGAAEFVGAAHGIGCSAPEVTSSIMRYRDSAMRETIELLASYAEEMAAQIFAKPNEPDAWTALGPLQRTLRAHALSEWVLKVDPLVREWRRLGLLESASAMRAGQDGTVRELRDLCLYLDFSACWRQRDRLASAVLGLAIVGVLGALLAWTLGGSQAASSTRTAAAAIGVFFLAAAGASPWWRQRLAAPLLRSVLGDRTPVEFAEALRAAASPRKQ